MYKNEFLSIIINNYDYKYGNIKCNYLFYGESGLSDGIGS